MWIVALLKMGLQVTDGIAREATAGQIWRVMPLVEPPFIVKTNDTERPYEECVRAIFV